MGPLHSRHEAGVLAFRTKGHATKSRAGGSSENPAVGAGDLKGHTNIESVKERGAGGTSSSSEGVREAYRGMYEACRGVWGRMKTIMRHSDSHPESSASVESPHKGV